jgi:predicted lactoylglutathione lyase
VKPSTVILALPVIDPERSLRFYRDGLSLSTEGIEDGMIAFELPNLSLFLIEYSQYEKYTHRAGVVLRNVPAPGACVMSCAIGSKAEVDSILARAAAAGGSVSEPARDRDGGYMGYFSDPDGHVWELVANPQTEAAAPSQS